MLFHNLQNSLFKALAPSLAAKVLLFLLLGAAGVGKGSASGAYSAYYIPSSSMENTLLPNDHILVSNKAYALQGPRFQEILICSAPTATRLPRSVHFVRRCIGLPHDTISVQRGKLFRNGHLVTEPYVKWDVARGLLASYDMKIAHGKVYRREYESPTDGPGPWMTGDVVAPDQAAITHCRPEPLPPDCYLALGDFRNNANDSHVWGFLKRIDLAGKVLLIYWPLRRWRRL